MACVGLLRATVSFCASEEMAPTDASPKIKKASSDVAYKRLVMERAVGQTLRVQQQQHQANAIMDCFSARFLFSDSPVGTENGQGNIKPNKQSVDITHFDMRASMVIGVGGFSVVRCVLKVSDKKHEEQIYALKQISKAKCLARPTGRAAVLGELQILKILSASSTCSDWICCLRHAFQDDKSLYMVMEHAIGDLRFHLKRQAYGRFSERMVRFYAVQLVHGLCAIHEHGILHRDVKPENILLDSDGYAKIADFGISKSVFAPDFLCHATSGTHGYMASEIYRRNPKPSHGHSFSADWFSLGVMLHELLTGVRPFEPAFLKACLGPPPLADNAKSFARCLRLFHSDPVISVDCKTFVSSLLALAPENRLGSGPNPRDIESAPWLKSYQNKALIFSRQLQPSYLPDFLGVAPTVPEHELREKIAELESCPAVPEQEFSTFLYNTDIPSTKSNHSSGDNSTRSSNKSRSSGEHSSRAGSFGELASCITLLLDPSEKENSEAMTRLKLRISNSARDPKFDPLNPRFLVSSGGHHQHHHQHTRSVKAWEMHAHLKSSHSCETGP